MSYNLNLNSPNLRQASSDAAPTASSTKFNTGTILGGGSSGSALNSTNPNKQNKKDVLLANGFNLVIGTVDSGTYKDTQLDEGSHVINTVTDQYSEVTCSYLFQAPQNQMGSKVNVKLDAFGDHVDSLLILAKNYQANTYDTLGGTSHSSGQAPSYSLSVDGDNTDAQGNIDIKLVLASTEDFISLSVNKINVEYTDRPVTQTMSLVDESIGNGEVDKSRETRSLRTVQTVKALNAGHWDDYNGRWIVEPTGVNDFSSIGTDKNYEATSTGRGLDGRITYGNGGKPHSQSYKPHDI